MKGISHDDFMAEIFRKDPAYAVELLNSILEDGTQDELLIVLRQMSKAFGGMSKVAEKSQNSPRPWVEPDDAPELTDDFFEQGKWKIGEKSVSAQEGSAALRKALARGRPKAETTKVALTVRYDADVIEAFRATGHGWQTRMNAVLKDWLKAQAVARL
ncbi:MAG: BrnA antitoxin family protein [Methylobacillus sp.]|jgi:uncharacterized protein (DUF4415 family)|nr:BrnA antitoxin family protein [Methylobacillus sp.]